MTAVPQTLAERGAVLARVATVRRVAALLALSLAVLLPASPGHAATVAPHRPFVDIVGDSFTYGFGPAACTLSGSNRQTCMAGAWWRTTVKELGWTVAGAVADPGGGFKKYGALGTYSMALDRFPLHPWVDYVIVQGSLNDNYTDPGTYPQAVAALLAKVHRQAPHAHIILTGTFNPAWPGKTYGPNQLAIARALGSPAAIGTDPTTVTYLSTYADAFTLSSDHTHPDGPGHQQLGRDVAWQAMNGPDFGTRLRYDRAVGAWEA